MFKKELQKRKDDVELILPDYIPPKSKGLDEVESEDVLIPRMSICQTMSPQRSTADPSYIEGLEEGNLFNTVTGTNYGSGPVRVIPLMFKKTRILFRPLEVGGGILCQSFNGRTGGVLSPESCKACPKSQWGKQGEKPECLRLMNYPAMVVKDNSLIIVSMKASSMKTARQWNSLLKQKAEPAFAKYYDISTQSATNNFGTFFIFALRPMGYVSKVNFGLAEKNYKLMTDFADLMDTSGLNVETEESEAASEL